MRRFEFLWFISMWAVSALMFCVVVWAITGSYWEREAVETGHAEFYLDNKHERQWRWKEVR